MSSYSDLHHALYHWYTSHGRHSLPWRTTRDPYHIYLSEIMLQQTQVKTVLERFYFPFLEQFPTLQALADAPLEKVLKSWEGMGYYSRARNLHKAAQTAAPTLPSSVEGLLALPGVGRNTAHAVAAFAFGKAVPVMEANVKRVLCRFFAIEKPTDTQLWEAAFVLLDKEQPFDYNQAMMDIGATVCTKSSPKCCKCPLATACLGKNDPQTYPQANIKKKVPIRQRAIVIWTNEHGQLYLKCRETQFLHGMYGFDEYNLADNPVNNNVDSIGSIVQHYSHFTLEGKVYTTPANGRKLTGGRWYNRKEIARLPLSEADKKVLGVLR